MVMESPKIPLSLRQRLRKNSVKENEIPNNVPYNDSDEPSCAICLEELKNTTEGSIDSCSHKFCFECILEWAKVTNSCPMCKKIFRKVTSSKTPVKTDKKGRVKKLSKEVKVKNKHQSNHFDTADFQVPSTEGERYRPRPTRSRGRTGPAPRRRERNQQQYEHEIQQVIDDRTVNVYDLMTAASPDGEEWEWLGDDDWLSPPRHSRPRPIAQTYRSTQPNRTTRSRGNARQATIAAASGQGQVNGANIRRRRTATQRSGSTAPVVVIDLDGVSRSPPRRQHISVAQSVSQPVASSSGMLHHRESMVSLSPLSDWAESGADRRASISPSAGWLCDMSVNVIPHQRPQEAVIVGEWFARHSSETNTESSSNDGDHTTFHTIAAASTVSPASSGLLSSGREEIVPILDISYDSNEVETEERVNCACPNSSPESLAVPSLRERLAARRRLQHC